jgi:hypothetical protein
MVAVDGLENAPIITWIGYAVAATISVPSEKAAVNEVGSVALIWYRPATAPDTNPAYPMELPESVTVPPLALLMTTLTGDCMHGGSPPRRVFGP